MIGSDNVSDPCDSHNARSEKSLRLRQVEHPPGTMNGWTGRPWRATHWPRSSTEVAISRIGGLFVGTIHGYCFRLLRQHDVAWLR